MNSTNTPDEHGFVPINLERAFALMYVYQNHSNRFKIDLGPGNTETLKGFSFPKCEIKKIVDNPEVARVYLGLGHHYGEMDPDGKPVNHLTLIAFGLDAQDKAVIPEGHIFDYCHPCPTKCPDYSDVLNSSRTDETSTTQTEDCN